MSRSRSRSTSRSLHRPSADRPVQDEMSDYAEKLMEIHRNLGDYIVVQHEGDSKARVLHFKHGAKKSNWNTVRLVNDKYNEESLSVGIVRALYPEEKQASGFLKNLQKKARNGESASAKVSTKERTNTMRKILKEANRVEDAEPQNTSGSSDNRNEQSGYSDNQNEQSGSLVRDNFASASGLDHGGERSSEEMFLSDEMMPSVVDIGEAELNISPSSYTQIIASSSSSTSSRPTENAKSSYCGRAETLSSAIRTIVNGYYWKKDTGNAVAIRLGYNIYVKKNVMRDLVDNYGPEAITRSGWITYAWQLVLHLLGGIETALMIKDQQKGVGVDILLREETLIAVLAHTRELFNIKDRIQLTWFKQRMNGNLNSRKVRHAGK